MSATSGIRICRLISPSFSAASRTGTAQRTTSQPAASSDQISSSVAWTSRVSAFVIDCTVVGAAPPTLTLTLALRRDLERPAEVGERELQLGELPESLGGQHRHVPGLDDALSDRPERPVRLVAHDLGDNVDADAPDLDLPARRVLFLLRDR